jgi:DNA-binding MarR family transcriptional regulator
VKQAPLRDQADEIADYWCRENPAVDPVTKTLAIRLRRAAHHLERELRRELSQHDADMWEFEVLLSLRRSEGYCKSAGALVKEAQVTSGAITNRVAQLEQRGWVRRDFDPSDRRQVLVSLTDEGLRRANQLLATKTETEQRLFGAVDRDTIVRMSDDLRTLLVTLEGSPAVAADEAAPATTKPSATAATGASAATGATASSRRSRSEAAAAASAAATTATGGKVGGAARPR